MESITRPRGGRLPRQEPRALVRPEQITGRIVMVRGEKVLLDEALAMLYGTSTGRLNEQVRRNLARFPEDFLFRLTNQEVRNLKSQFATSSWGGRRKLPLAFTEHGAIMAATILNTPHAVEVSIYVVRAFVRLRAVLSTHAALAKRLEEVERKTEALALQHDTLAADTRAQFKEVIEALRALMRPPEPARRPIGFVTPQEKESR
jgi:two-component sensor histidine kinase